MTDTPSATPNDPTGEPLEWSGGEESAAQWARSESADPQSVPTDTEPNEHEAGTPRFEGSGAARYAGEQVAPPPVTPQQPQQSPPPQQPQQPIAPQPSYGAPAMVPPQSQPQPIYGAPATTPPQPTYGAPGTGPQQTYGYQADSGSPTTLDVGNALSYGWEKFRANPVPWLGVTALGFLIYLVFVALVRVVNPTSLLPLLLIFLVVMVGIWLLQAALVRGALYETDGNKTVFGAYFHFVNAGNVLLTALLALVLTAIGWAFFIIPGIAIGVLCMFSLHFVVDQDHGPFTAIKSSASLVVSNLGQVLLLALAVTVITIAGTLLCGFGLLVAAPVTVIAVTYAYRALSGGVVSPL
ncbi:hypothetical protein [Nocardia australiensis]|uniref:hypothetical protein n=1 Tax=Nocardia australiensis TaxID=2887191 RepID=UPI001D13CE4F|nr:hypothetical protein [Nocardia australiensis]